MFNFLVLISSYKNNVLPHLKQCLHMVGVQIFIKMDYCVIIIVVIIFIIGCRQHEDDDSNG